MQTVQLAKEALLGFSGGQGDEGNPACIGGQPEAARLETPPVLFQGLGLLLQLRRPPLDEGVGQHPGQVGEVAGAAELPLGEEVLHVRILPVHVRADLLQDLLQALQPPAPGLVQAAAVEPQQGVPDVQHGNAVDIFRQHGNGFIEHVWLGVQNEFHRYLPAGQPQA